MAFSFLVSSSLLKTGAENPKREIYRVIRHRYTEQTKATRLEGVAGYWIRNRGDQAMEYTYDQLKGMTVAQMREIASGLEDEGIKGYTQLNKEHLLDALCDTLKIDTHTRHKSKVAGKEKAEIKVQMKVLKVKRNEALEAHDHARLKDVRRQLHTLRRSLRKAAASAAKK
jgi:hypothetical protein